MILVSAGHHAAAQGARAHGRTEWPEAMRWQEDILHTLGHRAGPVPTGLMRDKVKFINQSGPDLAIEIHFNSAKVGGKHVGRGSETLYKPGNDRSKHAATIIQAYLGDVFPPNRGAKEGWYRMDRPGVTDYQGDVEGDEKIDYFLRETNCPSIIIEPEFIHRHDVIDAGMGRGCLAITNACMTIIERWDL